MKLATHDFIPSLLVAAGLFGAVAVFLSETGSFRDAVSSWARRDLQARTELAASTLKEAVETGDFRRIHEFGESCFEDGVRLTIFSAPGGMVFDSAGRKGCDSQSIYATYPCGDFSVRLGLPLSRVLAPYRRARTGFALAGVVGGVGVLFVLLFTLRQRARLRELAREGEAQRCLLEEMRKVESFRRDFIADVSHEIKTPLTGIIGAVDLLSSADSLPADARVRLMGMLKAESSRLNDLVQGILSLARLERDVEDRAADFAPADISEIVRDVVGRVDLCAKEKGMAVKVDVPESCVAICDGQLVAAAISNLVTNAVKHSCSKSVEVSLFVAGEKVSVAVEDRGIGIPLEDRERVFDRFYRVDRSRSSDTGGSGLGLAIVRGIACLHGGEVRLEGVEPSGCRFVFSVPCDGRRRDRSNPS